MVLTRTGRSDATTNGDVNAPRDKHGKARVSLQEHQCGLCSSL